MSLTEKQRRFVEAYVGEAEGNATRAARLAGYSGNENALAAAASRTLRNAKVQSAIAEVTDSVRSEAVATRDERQEFLTKMMRTTDLEPKDRIKACEVLGKMQGDFIEKREVAVTSNVVRVVMPDNGRIPAPE